MTTIDETLVRLKKSTFRVRSHLSDKDKQYIADKGLDTIRIQAMEFVTLRISPAYPPNDRKQTPMRGTLCLSHSMLVPAVAVFVNKWYKVPLGVKLTENQQERIVNLLMAWIGNQLDVNKR